MMDINQCDITQRDLSHDNINQRDLSNDNITQCDINQRDLTQRDITLDDITLDDITRRDITEDSEFKQAMLIRFKINKEVVILINDKNIKDVINKLDKLDDFVIDKVQNKFSNYINEDYTYNPLYYRDDDNSYSMVYINNEYKDGIVLKINHGYICLKNKIIMLKPNYEQCVNTTKFIKNDTIKLNYDVTHFDD
jgi:hypothetical protein